MLDLGVEACESLWIAAPVSRAVVGVFGARGKVEKSFRGRSPERTQRGEARPRRKAREIP